MRIAVVLNGISRKKPYYLKAIHPGLSAEFQTELFITAYAGHAISIGRDLCHGNYDCVLAAGGDGTLNQVLNGLMQVAQPSRKLPSLGVIPLGTGNDFARTCRLNGSVDQLCSLLRQNAVKPTDVGIIQSLDHNQQRRTEYFINVCSLGMGPEVVRRLESASRIWGPDITYVKAILATFFLHHPQTIHAKSEHWEISLPARVLAVANGRTFGHAICLDPDAAPDDGVFSVFVARDLPWWKFIYCLTQAKRGKKLNMRGVTYQTCSSLDLTSAETCVIEAEGELKGFLPASISMKAGCIQFLR